MMAQRQNSLVEILRTNRDALTKNEARAAAELLSNYPLAGLQPIARFAADAGVSAQCVLRLIAKLGLENYGAFQDRLREELATLLQSPRGRLLTHEVGKTAAPDFMVAFRDRLTRNIVETLNAIQRAELNKAVSLITDNKKNIFVVGGRLTQSAALHLATHLHAMRPRVTLIEGQSSAWPDTIVDMGHQTTLIAFDIRRYQNDVVRLCDLAAERGARVILICDSRDAPAARKAAITFVAQTTSISAWDSFAALTALSELLIAGVSDQLGKTLQSRMDILDSVREEFFDSSARIKRKKS
jgi:DNA-binding MurR/RpiR family transcriptional regulator